MPNGTRSKLRMRDVLGQKFIVQIDKITGKVQQVTTPTHFRVGIEPCDAALTVTGPIYSLCGDTTSVISGNLIVCGSIDTGDSNIAWWQTLKNNDRSEGYHPTMTSGSIIRGIDSPSIAYHPAHNVFIVGGGSHNSTYDANDVIVHAGSASMTRAGSVDIRAGYTISGSKGGNIRLQGGDVIGSAVTASSGGDVYIQPGVGGNVSLGLPVDVIIDIDGNIPQQGDYGSTRTYVSNKRLGAFDFSSNSIKSIDSGTPIITFTDITSAPVQSLGGSPALTGSINTINASSSLYVRDVTPEIGGHVDQIQEPYNDVTTSNLLATAHTGNIDSLWIAGPVTASYADRFQYDDGSSTTFDVNDPYAMKTYPSLWIKRTNFISTGDNEVSSQDQFSGVQINQRDFRTAYEWWSFPQVRVTSSFVPSTTQNEETFDTRGSLITSSVRLGNLRSVFPDNGGGGAANIDIRVLGIAFRRTGDTTTNDGNGISRGLTSPLAWYSRRMRIYAWNREFGLDVTPYTGADFTYDLLSKPIISSSILSGEVIPHAEQWTTQLCVTGSEIALDVTGSARHNMLWIASWISHGDELTYTPWAYGFGGSGGGGGG